MGFVQTISELFKGISVTITCSASNRHSDEFNDLIVDLRVAAIMGDYKKVKNILTSNDVDINVVDDKGNTILHLAIINKNIEVVKTILKDSTGLNINFANNMGNTPLHQAALNNDLIMISLLINYGADKYIMNNYGETPYNLYDIDDETSCYILNYHSPK